MQDNCKHPKGETIPNVKVGRVTEPVDRDDEKYRHNYYGGGDE